MFSSDKKKILSEIIWKNSDVFPKISDEIVDFSHEKLEVFVCGIFFLWIALKNFRFLGRGMPSFKKILTDFYTWI